jgi:class 3 adenylate cyclase
MKRKIAAIFAADVAGYSRLIAEDEEETLRRLASYRSVMDDFITRAGGRVFNTAGDAVLAEFSSAVEAVRCAIDIQESLRTRNLAYPPSRQMNFRIGITVGDVVERNGDLLGDGVNIAARLEGIAPIGGICISRTVYEQVANKLSVQFADIGEQHVKNIPTPVHAYKFEMRPDDQKGEAKPPPAKRPVWLWPAGIGAMGAILIAVGVAGYWAGMTPGSRQDAGLSGGQGGGQGGGQPGPQAAVAPPPQAPHPQEALVPESIPLIPDRARMVIRDEYLAAADHKALAISSGPIGYITGQADDDTAKTAALDACQKRADALQPPRKCELYAVGATVVYARGRPPMPATPWVTHDQAIEGPLVAKDLPLVRDPGKAQIEKLYLTGKSPKALVLGPLGGFYYYFSQETADEAERRALELCGTNAGVPCLVVAVDNNVVVPIPAAMKVTGFFHPARFAAIAPEQRDAVARRLGNGTGWSAVATGADGHAGVAVQAANEQAAIDGALADCSKQDHSCHVIAIGPFVVENK